MRKHVLKNVEGNTCFRKFRNKARRDSCVSRELYFCGYCVRREYMCYPLHYEPPFTVARELLSFLCLPMSQIYSSEDYAMVMESEYREILDTYLRDFFVAKLKGNPNGFTTRELPANLPIFSSQLRS